MSDMFNNARTAQRRRWSEMMLELALAEGRKVMVVSPEGTTIRKRHGHLTSITPVPPATSGKSATHMIIDDYSPPDDQ